MDFLQKNKQKIQQSINKWYEVFDQVGMKTQQVNYKRTNLDGLSYLRSSLLELSQYDGFSRFQSEFKLINRLYVQSKYQIRSFPYLSTFRKFRQVLKKIDALAIAEKCANASISACQSQSLMTKESFHSLQWMCLAVYELLEMVEEHAMNLTELLTQELHPSIFLHFPIIYISIASSLSSIAEEIRPKIFQMFLKLRTIETRNLIDFPDDGFSGIPSLPWDPAFEVNLDNYDKQINLNLKPKPLVQKIDFKITQKPNTQLRGKSTVSSKPKSALDALGF